MAILRHKRSGHVTQSSRFNIFSLSEIVISTEDGEQTSDYWKNYDVMLDGEWVDMQQAFAEHRLIPDNYNVEFRKPANEVERAMGYYG